MNTIRSKPKIEEDGILTQCYTICSRGDMIPLRTIPAVDELAIVRPHILLICPDHTFVEQPTDPTAVVEVDRYERAVLAGIRYECITECSVQSQIVHVHSMRK